MGNAANDRPRRTARLLGSCLLCAALLMLAADAASAKKPVKPPPVPTVGGTIYYVQDGALHKMSSDGSGDATLSTSILYWAEPSTLLHNSQRWFLQVQAVSGAYYPAPAGGTALPQLELFAVNEPGTSIVQLTNGRIDASTYIEPNPMLGGAMSETSCVVRWTAADTLVSYTALRTSYDAAGSRTVLDGGVYALGVAPAALSTHVATPMSGYPLLPLQLNATGVRVLAQSYDWKPDGSAIVYPNPHASNPQDLGVWVAWASDGFTTPTYLMANGAQLRWSADGSRILYNYDGIRSIGADGSGARLLVADPADTPREARSVDWPTWSPDGTHIAYRYKTFNVRKFRITYDVFRATDTGGSATEISADKGSLPRWR